MYPLNGVVCIERERIGGGRRHDAEAVYFADSEKNDDVGGCEEEMGGLFVFPLFWV